MSENYYEILGLPQDATIAQIKSAFRKLAHKYHPDKNPNKKELFALILKAYETLSDIEKKKQYDRSLQYNNTYTETPDKLRKQERWEVSKEDLQRRKYYKDYFERLKKEHRVEQEKQNNQSLYNEWQYWLYAAALTVLIVILVIWSYQTQQ